MGNHAAPRVSRPEAVREEAEAQANPVTSGPVLAAVSAGVGNAAITRMIVQRTPATAAAQTPAEVKALPGFAGVDDLERVRLINVLLDQFWVGPDDELALESIWRSLLNEDHLVSFIEANPGLWEKCIDRGAELTEIRPYRDVKTHFTNDIIALARHYLTDNETVVQHELDALGPEGEPPGPDQAARIAALQAAADTLTTLQQAQEAAREARVGWRIGDGGEVDPDWTGRQVKYQVKFSPGGPPPLTQEPPDLPNGDIFLRPIVSYAQVKEQFDNASKAIAKRTEDYPALIGLARGGSSEATNAFVTDQDPRHARERLAAPLKKVLADIVATRGYLGGELDPLDLTPLHEQLYGGHAAVGGATWTRGFRHEVAAKAAQEHAIDRALTRLALQSVTQLAYLLAPLTSGASLVVVLGVAAVAQGVQAYGSYREAQVTSAAEGATVRPRTELVAPGSAEFARMNAEADAIAFGLALLALGAEAFQAWRARAQARAQATEERIQMHHGTDEGGHQGLGGLEEGRIDVRRTGGADQDLGQGFYLTLDEDTAMAYADRRAIQRGTNGRRVLTFEIRRSELGDVVDIRKGGNYRAQWEEWLKAKPQLPGGGELPTIRSNRDLITPRNRGEMFDKFLDHIGKRRADTIIAPLGDDVFSGIESPHGESAQVCIRSQAVADRLNAQITTGR
jgi:hypothetical protein